MSGLEIVGGISAVITFIDASVAVWESARKDLKLSTTFETVANRLPILRDTLQTCRERFVPVEHTLPESTREALTKTIANCKSKAEKLDIIFQEIIPGDNDQWCERYRKVARRLGKGSKVEELLKTITEDAQNLVNYQVVKSTSPELYTQLEAVIKDIDTLEPSLLGENESGNHFDSGGGEQYIHTGSGVLKVNKSSGGIGEYSGSGNPVFNFGKK